MKTFYIKSLDVNNIKYLNDSISSLKRLDSNFNFHLDNIDSYNNIVITYSGNSISDFIDNLSDIFALLILDNFEDILLLRLITKKYNFFSQGEKAIIVKYSKDLIYEDSSISSEDRFLTLKDIFKSHFEKNYVLFLDGFINFRLYNYTKLLEKYIQEAVDMYNIEIEYNNFISLLKSYVNSSPSNLDLVHLIYNNSNSILLDKDYLEIVNTSLLDFKYLSDISFSSNDFTLNSLISLLPKKIIIHHNLSYIDDFITTLINIFGDRVYLSNFNNLDDKLLKYF